MKCFLFFLLFVFIHEIHLMRRRCLGVDGGETCGMRKGGAEKMIESYFHSILYTTIYQNIYIYIYIFISIAISYKYHACTSSPVQSGRVHPCTWLISTPINKHSVCFSLSFLSLTLKILTELIA